MLKIRRPLGRLIFNMGIATPGKTVFLIETAPWMWVFRRKWKHNLFLSVSEIMDVDHLCSQLFSLSVWFVSRHGLANTIGYFLLTVQTFPKCFIEFQCQVVKINTFFPSQDNIVIMTSRKLHCVHLQSIWTKTKHDHWFWIGITELFLRWVGAWLGGTQFTSMNLIFCVGKTCCHCQLQFDGPVLNYSGSLQLPVYD